MSALRKTASNLSFDNASRIRGLRAQLVPVSIAGRSTPAVESPDDRWSYESLRNGFGGRADDYREPRRDWVNSPQARRALLISLLIPELNWIVPFSAIGILIGAVLLRGGGNEPQSPARSAVASYATVSDAPSTNRGAESVREPVNEGRYHPRCPEFPPAPPENDRPVRDEINRTPAPAGSFAGVDPTEDAPRRGVHSPVDVTINGTFISGAKHQVVTAEGLLEQGDMVGSYKIASVDTDSVILTGEGSTFTLDLGSQRWSERRGEVLR